MLPSRGATKPAQPAQFAEAEVQISEASDLDLNFQFERVYGLTTTVDCACAKGWEAKLAYLPLRQESHGSDIDAVCVVTQATPRPFTGASSQRSASNGSGDSSGRKARLHRLSTSTP